MAKKRLTRDGRDWLWYTQVGFNYKGYDCDVGSFEWLNYLVGKETGYFVKKNGKYYNAKNIWRHLLKLKDTGKKLEIYNKFYDLKFEMYIEGNMINVFSVYDCGKLDSTEFDKFV